MSTTTSQAMRYLEAVSDCFGDRTLSGQKLGWAKNKALRQAIKYDREFDLGDFKQMGSRRGYFSGSWHVSYKDDLYSVACERANAGHASAAKSIEHWLAMKPFLWAEKTRKRDRLCVGSEFTWKGHRVKVTSFSEDRQTLTACGYEAESRKYISSDQPIDEQVGCEVYELRGYREIQYAKTLEDGAIALRYGPAKPWNDGQRTVERRFKITVDDLDAEASAMNQRVKAAVADLRGCVTLDDLRAVRERITQMGKAAFRHFDLEVIRDTVAKLERSIANSMSKAEREREEARLAELEAEALQRWVDGGEADRYFRQIRLRVKGSEVEVSNGNSVTVEDARKALPMLLPLRKKDKVMTLDIGLFQLRSVHPSRGVTIGCTTIPWSEVERLNELLMEAGL